VSFFIYFMVWKKFKGILFVFQLFIYMQSTGRAQRMFDKMYPGTAVQRMNAARKRAKGLSPSDLSVGWEAVRRKILWAAGLRDLRNAKPGEGYTGHAFNDWNHVDACTMIGDVVFEENEGRVEGMHYRNPLGNGIRLASDPSLGEGGTWSTCMQGCHHDPPQDVAHVQFKSRIAFKLVWIPPRFQQFALVDDDGELLAWGEPKNGNLPHINERKMNFMHVQNSKYGKNAFERTFEGHDSSL
jgi:hypothetical protein